MEVLKMQCKHKDCEENWASDDQWAFDKDGYCIRCKDKTNIRSITNEKFQRKKDGS